MSVAAVEVRRALYGKMAGDATLTALLGSPATNYSKAIYYEQAPSGAAFPYIIFQKQAGGPRYAFANTNTIQEEVWLIKAVDHATSADAADTIHTRLDVLLTDGVISISGKTELYLRRDTGGDVDYGELTDGERYVHSGSLFRLIYA